MSPVGYVALWIDSEDPLADVEKTWEHLRLRDNWNRPSEAGDEQVLLMTTCMESLIVADRAPMDDHYKAGLQRSALPPIENLEERGRRDIQQSLAHATRNCTNAYAKGERSFQILAKLSPVRWRNTCPSFARTRRILDRKL